MKLTPDSTQGAPNEDVGEVKLSARALDLPLSGIRLIYDMARAIPDVIHLEIGEPDLPTPAHIARAAQDAISEGLTHYTPSAGTPGLREAAARKLRRENDLDYDPSEVMVTNGANVALSLALLALVDPGSEVLIPDPGWANYTPMMKLVQASPRYYALREEDDFRPRIPEMASLVTEKTRAILLNSPSNPTGGVLTKDDLEEISSLATKRNLVVIADEVYEKFLYDGAEHHSIARFRGMRNRTVTINAFSKTYRMTGWRLGYAAGPAEVIDAMVRLNSCMNTCSSSVSQAAGEAALNGPQDCVKEMVEEYRSRRDLFIDGLNKVKGFRSAAPKGAFYAFANVRSMTTSSTEFCIRLLEKARVATVPGISFGSTGEGYLRFSFSAPRHALREALDRIDSYTPN
jgi:aspartate/methionine/tyrosine aminotransferase